MPNILPLEVVVVGAGFLVLCVAPALVAWADALARRRLQRQEAVPPPAAAPAAEGEPAAQYAAVPTDLAGPGVVAPQGAASATTGLSVPEEPAPAPASVPVQVGEPEAAPPPAVAAAPIPAVPAAVVREEGEATYEFRLLDLRRARLLDWPPVAIRQNAERHRVWQEGARLAAAHQGRIDTATLHAPYTPRSACFGTAEAAASGLRLRYLLFSDLWPVAESQAVGEAVFEIDGVAGEVRGWLEPHRPVS